MTLGSAFAFGMRALHATGQRHSPIVAVVLAVAALALLLGDLTTEGHPTNNPESQRADALIAQGFPPDPSRATSDLVVIRSARYTVDAPLYRAFVSKLVADGRATGGVANARVYYVTHDKTQVSSRTS